MVTRQCTLYTIEFVFRTCSLIGVLSKYMQIILTLPAPRNRNLISHNPLSAIIFLEYLLTYKFNERRKKESKSRYKVVY